MPAGNKPSSLEDSLVSAGQFGPQRRQTMFQKLSEADLLSRGYARRANDAGACVVVFPELALTGYPPRDLLEKESFLHAVGGGTEVRHYFRRTDHWTEAWARIIEARLNQIK
jgi:hypothetical protein